MQYSGEDNLDVLQQAHKYNDFLVTEVCRYIDTHTAKVIDFGAGEGYLADFVAQKSDREIICIEPAENLEKFYTNKKHYKSLEHISDESVDYIYSLNVLEHIEDDAATIDLFYQKLRKGGKIFLYVPAFNVLYSSMDKKVGHFRRYSKKAVFSLFSNQQKWQISKFCYADFLGFFVTLIFKIIGNSKGDVNPQALRFYDAFLFPLSRFLDKLTCGKILGKNICVVVEKK